MDNHLLEKLKTIVGEANLLIERNCILNYLYDETGSSVRPEPAQEIIVVTPHTSEEIAHILKLANTRSVPVFPRGAGTGLVGGAIPTINGIVLSLEKMNKIIEVDAENLMAVAEAGVPFINLDQEARRYDLFFPPHPGDESAQLGGIVACNAGGVRCVKYGVIRDYVKGMEVVLPTGDILVLGGKLLKNATGYDLMHLMIGSQGTLGIITKVILKLYPTYPFNASLIMSFSHRHEALTAVPQILQKRITPLAVEYFDKQLIELSAKNLGKKWPIKTGAAFLYLLITAETESEIFSLAEKIDQICRGCGAIEGIIETNKQKQDNMLAMRSHIYSSLKSQTADILDISVPPASIRNLFDALEKIAQKYRIYMPMYGHAADGNLHVHIINGTLVTSENLAEIKRLIYLETKNLKGILTGEHGVGKIRINHLGDFLSKKHIELMKAIKSLFDPENILNPGTIIAAK